MSGKLTNYDNVPLPQDLTEGVDESEWVKLYFLCFAYFCIIYPFNRDLLHVYVLPDSLLPIKTIAGKLKTLKLESGWKISDQLVEINFYKLIGYFSATFQFQGLQLTTSMVIEWRFPTGFKREKCLLHNQV